MSHKSWCCHSSIQQKQTVKIRAIIPKKYRQITGTYSSLLYTGKPTREPGEHYLAITDDTVKHLVTNRRNYADMQGHKISCDRYYTSLYVANWLLGKKSQLLTKTILIAKVLVNLKL